MLCSERNFYFNSHAAKCAACAGTPLSFFLGLLFGVIALLAFLWLLRRWLLLRPSEASADAMAHAMARARRGWQRVRRAVPACKIVFSFYQIVSVLGEVMCLAGARAAYPLSLSRPGPPH